jgi:phosphate transport system substrate-binding protein
MGGLLTAVADYHNAPGAIGYSFRYFVVGMHDMPGIKLLAVDGIAPTMENITSGRYPLTMPVYAVTRDSEASAKTKALLEWITGSQGQELVKRAGLAPIRAEENEAK